MCSTCSGADARGEELCRVVEHELLAAVDEPSRHPPPAPRPCTPCINSEHVLGKPPTLVDGVEGRQKGGGGRNHVEDDGADAYEIPEAPPGPSAVRAQSWAEYP